MTKTFQEYYAEVEVRAEKAAEDNRGEINLDVEEVLDTDIPALVARCRALEEIVRDVAMQGRRSKVRERARAVLAAEPKEDK